MGVRTVRHEREEIHQARPRKPAGGELSAMPASAGAAALLRLQRSASNHAVGQMLQRVKVNGENKSNFMMAAQLTTDKARQNTIKAALESLPADREFHSVDELRLFLVGEKLLEPPSAETVAASSTRPPFEVRKRTVEAARVKTVQPNLAGATVSFGGRRYREHLKEGDGQARLDLAGAVDVVRKATPSQLEWSLMQVDVAAVDADFDAVTAGKALRAGTYEYRVRYARELTVIFSTSNNGQSVRVFHIGPGG